MVILSLTCFTILKGLAALFNMTMTTLDLAGENDWDLYHNGHGVHAFVELGFVSPIIQKLFPFKDMTQDFACSFITRYIGQANAFGFTTSFADVNSEQLNTHVHFDTDSVFFVCVTQPLAMYVMTFRNLSRVAFNK
jgi:hypothetical protein